MNFFIAEPDADNEENKNFYFQTDVFAMLGVAGLLRSSCLSLSSLKQGTVQRLCAHAGEMTPGISVRMQEK